MLRLKEIEIQNYKSLVNTQLKLNDQLTALIGINGAGKTNTLSAIMLLAELAKGRRHARYSSEKEHLAKSELVATFQSHEMDFKLKAILYFDNLENDDGIKYFELFIKRIGKSFKWEKLNPDVFDFVDYLNHKSHAAVNTRSLENEYLPKEQTIRSLVLELSPFLGAINYYGATIFSDPTKSPISFELEEQYLGRRSYGTRSLSHKKFLYDLYTLKAQDKKAFKRYLNTVNHLGVNLVNNIVFSQINVPSSSVKILAGGQTEKINTRKKFVVPVFTIENLQLSPSQLSEGTFKTLALIFYILNDKSQLMLIEEPEVCVHHGLLSSVIELIKRQSLYKQIIISTHSDYVLDKLKPENVVLVKRSEAGTNTKVLEEALSTDDFSALKIYLEESGNLGEYWKEDGFFGE